MCFKFIKNKNKVGGIMWIFFMDWTLKTGKEIVSQDIKY